MWCIYNNTYATLNLNIKFIESFIKYIESHLNIEYIDIWAFYVRDAALLITHTVCREEGYIDVSVIAG